ncbi:MAG: hypothetical protein H6727_03475 [Myxococcales bacterium]|nr:hypothetical protein [Myxococcales bacterium]
MQTHLQERTAMRWGVSLGLAGLCFFSAAWGLLAAFQKLPLSLRWNHILFCFLLGVCFLYLGWRYRQPRVHLSAADLVQLGVGQIRAQQNNTTPTPYICGSCGQTFSTKPFHRDDLVFPAPACELETRLQDAARQKARLAPPLPPEEIIQLLAELIQLAEGVMQQSQSGEIDPRGLLLARHQKGIVGRFHQLLTSLYLYNLQQWATRLEKAPPPNINEHGQVEGSQRFFEVARTFRDYLLENEWRTINPFAQLHLKEELTFEKLQQLRETSNAFSLAQKQALGQLDVLMQREEARWQEILHKRGSYPVTANKKGCPYNKLPLKNKRA